MSEIDIVELRAWLRVNAKQVKTFEVDRWFTGNITTYEGEDRNPRTFENLGDLKYYYGNQRENKESSQAVIAGPRGFLERIWRAIKGIVENKKREGE